MSKSNKIVSSLVIAVAIVIIMGAYLLFSPLSRLDSDATIYITEKDNIDSVYSKMESICEPVHFVIFKQMMTLVDYSNNIRHGRYEITTADQILDVFKRMKNGSQSSVKVTIPPVRTLAQLTSKMSSYLNIDSTDLYNTLRDEGVCRQYGYDTTSIIAMFIPNTYDIYWDTTIDKFLKRMKRECDKFWQGERMTKAEAMGLTPVQVSTLASIVDEETSFDEEKPIIAGLYYNRLCRGMRLQADPTVKFAIGDFTIKRIHHNMLSIDSPYNTYKHKGLPPGPIRIPTVVAIESVLNHQHHNYIFMCAKEDFSGKHNFAVTAEEHMKNAKRYSTSLDKNGIE
ncbi:MAG: endolytic transglycosylase MltG [Prevotella sp.]|nr:endolytic transglycosylase MltG [Candidatus Equicola stercoris]